MNMSMNIPMHPFVECNIEGVNAHALIDTGSMKSFIRQDIYNTIDFEGTRLGEVNEQCKSITGDPLNLLGKLNASIKFIGSHYLYSDNFLVSSDIQFDCTSGLTGKLGFALKLFQMPLQGLTRKLGFVLKLFQAPCICRGLSSLVLLQMKFQIAVWKMVRNHTCCISHSIRLQLRFISVTI